MKTVVVQVNPAPTNQPSSKQSPFLEMLASEIRQTPLEGLRLRNEKDWARETQKLFFNVSGSKYYFQIKKFAGSVGEPMPELFDANNQSVFRNFALLPLFRETQDRIFAGAKQVGKEIADALETSPSDEEFKTKFGAHLWFPGITVKNIDFLHNAVNESVEIKGEKFECYAGSLIHRDCPSHISPVEIPLSAFASRRLSKMIEERQKTSG